MTTEEEAAQFFSKLVSDVENNSARDPTPSGFNLQDRGERDVFTFGSASLLEEVTTTQYVGSYGGPSLRVMRGFWYRWGNSSGHRETHTSIQIVDEGRLAITTHAIYYGGRHNNFRIPYKRVLQFKQYPDSIGITQDGRKEIILAPHIDYGGIRDLKDIGYYVCALVQALAKKNA